MTKICRGCAAQIPNCLHCFCAAQPRIKFNFAESRWSSAPSGPARAFSQAGAPATPNHAGAFLSCRGTRPLAIDHFLLLNYPRPLTQGRPDLGGSRSARIFLRSSNSSSECLEGVKSGHGLSELVTSGRLAG